MPSRCLTSPRTTSRFVKPPPTASQLAVAHPSPALRSHPAAAMPCSTAVCTVPSPCQSQMYIVPCLSQPASLIYQVVLHMTPGHRRSQGLHIHHLHLPSVSRDRVCSPPTPSGSRNAGHLHTTRFLKQSCAGWCRRNLCRPSGNLFGMWR